MLLGMMTDLHHYSLVYQYSTDESTAPNNPQTGMRSNLWEMGCGTKGFGLVHRGNAIS